jgi:hypothetical protein
MTIDNPQTHRNSRSYQLKPPESSGDDIVTQSSSFQYPHGRLRRQSGTSAGAFAWWEILR